MKATPVAEFVPELPNTMAWTFTAVPSRPRMSYISRYLIARGLFQEPNTALMPARNCSFAQVGKALPVAFFTTS